MSPRAFDAIPFQLLNRRMAGRKTRPVNKCYLRSESVYSLVSREFCQRGIHVVSNGCQGTYPPFRSTRNPIAGKTMETTAQEELLAGNAVGEGVALKSTSSQAAMDGQVFLESSGAKPPSSETGLVTWV
jgi:hypothetical protein